MGLENLHALFEQADAIDRDEGKVAYWRYHATLRMFAGRYRVPFDRVVAAFVALSPNNSYASNLRSLASVLAHKGAEDDRIVVSTYNHCKHRALSYVRGKTRFLDTVRGLKTRAFYANIVDPADPHPVTIDGHMHAAWAGMRWTMREASLNARRYHAVAEDVRQVGKAHDLGGNQVQAILWFARKRTLGIVYDPQWDLLAGKDAWGSVVDPEDCPPYPLRHVQLIAPVRHSAKTIEDAQFQEGMLL